MTPAISDEQLQAIQDYWLEGSQQWHQDFFDLVATGRPLYDQSDSQACLWIVLQALRERDATIAELRDKRFCEVEPEGESHDMSAGMICVKCWNKVASELAQLRNSALSYQLQRDQANALVKKQEQMLAELRKPVEVERNDRIEEIRSEMWLCEGPTYTELAHVLSAHDTLALRLADRVRMLGFVQDQLTARNKENEELKDRERQLREVMQSIADTSLEVSERVRKYAHQKLAALAQPTENSNGTV